MSNHDTLAAGLDAAARATSPAAPPADLWTRGRRRRSLRRAATATGVTAAVAALVVPAVFLSGLVGSDADTDPSDLASSAPALGVPDRLYDLPDDLPRERAPGPLAVVREADLNRGAGPPVVVGVSAEDGRTVRLTGVPATGDGGLAGAPSLALSPDGGLLAYARGRDVDRGRGEGPNELVVRDLRSGTDTVTDLSSELAARISGLRPMSFSGGVLMVSIDHLPDQSLRAVDPVTGSVRTLAPRQDPLTFPGGSSEEPVFVVGRRVYTGAEPAEGREPAYVVPRGFSVGPVVTSPDGSRAAMVLSELYDGTPPEDPFLQVVDLDGSAEVTRLAELPDDGAVQAWLPDGRLVTYEASPPTVGATTITWRVQEPDGRVERRVMQLDEQSDQTLVVATDLLGEPLVPGVDPDPFGGLVLALVAGVSGALVIIGVVVLLRRRHHAEG